MTDGSKEASAPQPSRPVTPRAGSPRPRPDSLPDPTPGSPSSGTQRTAQRVHGPNYAARRGTFEVTRNGKPVVTMHPEKRIYPVTGMPTTEAAIHTTGFADLYVVRQYLDAQRGGWA